MYFENRAWAGYELAKLLYDQYRYEDCAVIALSDGAVQVGEQIAASLHCILTMLLAEDIGVPGESLSFGGVSQEGNFTYSHSLSESERDEYSGEFHGYLEEKKRELFQKMNKLLGEGGLINHDMLRDRIIILVSDGLDDSIVLDVAIDFLKPIRIQKLVVVAPFATVSAVDRLHVIADELHVLDVKSNFMGVDHYYEHNDVPSHEEVVAKINNIVLNWQ